jgi:hypothetical protein
LTIFGVSFFGRFFGRFLLGIVLGIFGRFFCNSLVDFLGSFFEDLWAIFVQPLGQIFLDAFEMDIFKISDYKINI